jgi:hypothetical protein
MAAGQSAQGHSRTNRLARRIVRFVPEADIHEITCVNRKNASRRSLRNLKQRLRECRPRKSLNYGQNELMCVLQLQSRRPTGQVTSKRYFKAKMFEMLSRLAISFAV